MFFVNDFEAKSDQFDNIVELFANEFPKGFQSKGTKNEPGDWIEDKFEEAFADFEAKIDACYSDSDKLSEKTVTKFLDFLMSQKTYI